MTKIKVSDIRSLNPCISRWEVFLKAHKRKTKVTPQEIVDSNGLHDFNWVAERLALSYTGILCETGGNKWWYLNGKRHREDGPAIEWSDGYTEWWVNGRLHREDGPAMERASGYKAWYRNGQRHREDGPAVEWPDGTKEWWVNGVQINENQSND